jgi:peptide-methionine (R)-S-oxide reductase
MRTLHTWVGILALGLGTGCFAPGAEKPEAPQQRTLVLAQSQTSPQTAPRTRKRAVQQVPIREATPTVVLTDQEWRQRLSPEQYRVLRQEGTEQAWTGALLKNDREGVYRCAGCGNELFASDTKYDSKTGWPSYYAPLTPDAVGTKLDNKMRSPRVEVHCSSCGGHLGHVFTDGPDPTGLRYCINSVAMTFDEKPGVSSVIPIEQE